MWTEWRAFLPTLDDCRRQPLSPVECLDLAERPDLEQSYGWRVPVLEADGHELCRYFFDPAVVLAYLDRIR